MKTYITTLYRDNWNSEEERERMRDDLNKAGFYVLHGIDDTLEVYALEYQADIISVFCKAVNNFLRRIIQ